MGQTGEVKTGESPTGDQLAPTLEAGTLGTRPPARGPHVVVGVAQPHSIHTPTVIDELARRPAANSLPGIGVPVPRNDKWEQSVFEDADLRVWHDGERQPVDKLERTTAREDRHVLDGRGGLELLQRVTAEYGEQAIHTAAKNLIENNTNYTANVDTPETTTETNTTLDTRTTTAEFQAGLARPPAPTDAWEVSNSAVRPLQSCFTTEGESADRTTGNAAAIDDSGVSGEASNDQVLEVKDTGDTAEWDFTLDYTIRSDDFGVQVRDGDTGSVLAFTWYLVHDNGTEYQLDTIGTGTVSLSFGWTALDGNTYNGDGYQGPDLTPGDYTLKVEVDDGQTSSEDYVVDVVAPHDTRFSYTFDDSVDGNDSLSGPELYPDSQDVIFAFIPSTKAVTGAKALVTMNDTGGSNLNLHLSNDQGDNFTSGISVEDSQTATFETDSLGASFGPGVTFKITLGRHGSQTATPTSGITGDNLRALTIQGDLDTTPIVVNQAFDGTLLSILQQLADQGDFVFGVEIDNDGNYSIEWTQVGQRSSSKSPSVTGYEVERITADDDQFDKVAVFGSAQQVTGATFESNHGTAVSLASDRLHEGKERVYDSDTGEVFVRGPDYTMDYSAGTITTVSGGDMDDATVYSIDYVWQTFGEFDNGARTPTVGPPQEIPGLTSDRQCQQAARVIVDAAEHPRHEARVVLPFEETGWSVVDDLSLPDVPTFGQSLHVKGVEHVPGQTVLTLGDREPLGDIVGDIRSRVGRTARKA